MTTKKRMIHDNVKWLCSLTEPQCRAFACQHGVKAWKTDKPESLISALGVMPMVTIIREVMEARV